MALGARLADCHVFRGGSVHLLRLLRLGRESSRELRINALSPGVNLGLFAAMIAISGFLSGYVTGKSLDRRGWLAWAAVLSIGGAGVLWWSPGTFGVMPVVALALGQGVCFARR